MQESNYTYRFLNEAGLHYCVNNGILDLSGPPKFLRNAPDGWQQQSLKWLRSMTDFGVIRGFTIPLKFVTEGAYILRKLFLEKGYEAFCTMIINEVDPETRVLKEIFRGDVDFTTFNSQDDFVEVSIIEGGLHKLAKAGEGTVNEIPVIAADTINVKMDGLNIEGKQRYSVPEMALDPFDEVGYFSYTYLMVKLTTEGNAPGIILNPQEFENMGTGGSDFSDSASYFLKAATDNPAPIVVTISGTIKLKLVTLRDNPTIRIRIVKSPEATPLVVSFTDIYNPTVTADPFTFEGETRDFNYSYDITVNPGDRLFLYGEIGQGTGTGDAYGWEILPDSTLAVNFINRLQTTIIKARKPFHVLEEITKAITDNTYLSKSDLLTSAYQSEFVLTSLNAILGRPEQAVIKTHLNDFFKFCHTRFSATKYVDDQNRLRIESITNAFDPTIIFDIGPVKDLQWGPIAEMLFNDLEAGYETQTYEDVNGRYEFNAKQKWKAPVTRTKNVLDMVCPYRADPYGIEISRISLNGQETTDNSGDNEVFILHVDLTAPEIIDGEAVYPLKRPAYTAITGVPDNTIFNRECSPKYGLLNNKRWLRSLLWKLEPGELMFKTAEKNGKLSTTLAGVTVSESEDIEIGDMGDPIVIPVSASFEPIGNIDIVTILATNPRGLIKFNWKDRDYYGFILEINKQPATDSATQWKLIFSPQDLTHLENG